MLRSKSSKVSETSVSHASCAWTNLSLAGIDPETVKVDRLKWIKGDTSHFNLKNPFVLIIPGSAPQHPYKRWPKDHYVDLIKSLISHKFQIVLLGTDDEKDVTEYISKAVPETPEACPNALRIRPRQS